MMMKVMEKTLLLRVKYGAVKVKECWVRVRMRVMIVTVNFHPLWQRKGAALEVDRVPQVLHSIDRGITSLYSCGCCGSKITFGSIFF